MKKIKDNYSTEIISHFDFIASGLSCHALCLIEKAKILSNLVNEGGFSQQKLTKYKNQHLLRAALVTLVSAKILSLSNSVYYLTSLGKELAKNIGAIMLPFVGYRNLLAKQFDLLERPTNWNESDIDYPAIAEASIGFGLHDLDPIILDVFKTLKPKGTICDLGCGTGEKLIKICQATKCSGLGFERSSKVIKESKKYTKHNPQVEIVQADITNLKGIWEDVEVTMISFVFHDISHTKKSIDFLRSIWEHFPRSKCLVVIDIVSLSENLPSVLPGFDYVHGLQGITPRTYEQTLEIFSKGNVTVFKEIEITNMPNTFLWILEPNKPKK